jgi:hypothetical protein
VPDAIVAIVSVLGPRRAGEHRLTSPPCRDGVGRPAGRRVMPKRPDWTAFPTPSPSHQLVPKWLGPPRITPPKLPKCSKAASAAGLAKGRGGAAGAGHPTSKRPKRRGRPRDRRAGGLWRLADLAAPPWWRWFAGCPRYPAAPRQYDPLTVRPHVRAEPRSRVMGDQEEDQCMDLAAAGADNPEATAPMAARSRCRRSTAGTRRRWRRKSLPVFR